MDSFCRRIFRQTRRWPDRKKQGKYTTTIFMILSLMMGMFKTFICLIKKHLTGNKLQLISQFEQTGTHANRYDVTILVNGLPLVHIELKKSEALPFVKPLTKSTAIPKRALIKTIRCLNTYKSLSSQTAPIPAILPIPPNETKTALILR